MKFHGKVYQTNPVILHASGESKHSAEWAAVVAHEARMAPAIPKGLSLSIVSWSNFLPQLQLLDRVAGQAKLLPRYLCLRLRKYQTGANGDNIMEVWADKVRRLKDAVETGAIASDYVLGLDDNDVVAHGDLGRAVGLLKNFSCRMVFGGEISPWPAHGSTIGWEALHAHGKYAYLNAGAWVAETKFLRELFFAHRIPDTFNEQGYWKDHYRTCYPDIRVDCEAQVFGNLQHARDDFSVEA
jgi:hypothetical protein